MLDIRGSPISRILGADEVESIEVNFHGWKCKHCGRASFWVLPESRYGCASCGTVMSVEELRNSEKVE